MEEPQTSSSLKNIAQDLSTRSAFIAGFLLGLLLILLPITWSYFFADEFVFDSLNYATDFLLVSFALGYGLGGIRDQENSTNIRNGTFALGMTLIIAISLFIGILTNDEEIERSLLIYLISVISLITMFFVQRSGIVSRALDKEGMFTGFIRAVSIAGYGHYLYLSYFEVFLDYDNKIFFDFVWLGVIVVTFIAAIIILIPEVKRAVIPTKSE